jgi:hypothetical protein
MVVSANHLGQFIQIETSFGNSFVHTVLGQKSTIMVVKRE